VTNWLLRIKMKLRNGEVSVSGDQWPIFLYHGYSYDEEDPWNGLLRSALLVMGFVHSPSSRLAAVTDYHDRLSNTFSLCQSSVERDQDLRGCAAAGYGRSQTVTTG
jgi:hypothetical protein